MVQPESGIVLIEHHETDNLDPRADVPARPGTPVYIVLVQLGNITVPAPVVLSPMAGVTNWPFRVTCEEYGPDGLYAAEVITVRALVAHNPRALRLCYFAKSEKTRSLQLHGVNFSIAEQAAKIVVGGSMTDYMDLNFGCPVPKVTCRGGGLALSWKTDIFTELLQRVVAVCEPVGIPVTMKICVGIDHNHETFLEAGHIAQEEGCKTVILHARITAEYYGGHSDWSRIGELKKHLSTLVFGNGDIWDAEDVLEMVRETGCDGVATGRGCQGRPWLFANIKNALEDNPERLNPNLGEVYRAIHRHAELLIEFYEGDEMMAVHNLRGHIAQYLKGFPVGGSIHKAFMERENLADVDCEIGKFDPTVEYLSRVVDKPRGRVRFAKKVHLPYGWSESRTTTHEKREVLFGDDPMDTSY